jgi:thioredoxin 1
MSDRILKFSASWCGPCKALKAEIAGEDLGVPVEEVDIDLNRDAAIEYGIRGVPTMILFRDDAESGRIVGFKTASEIRRWVENCRQNSSLG